MNKVVAIFTGKDLKRMQEEGGSAYWVVNASKVKQAKYVLLIRNLREQWAVKDGVTHGQAFMIGKISGCINSDKYPKRKIVQISEYALLPDSEEFKNAWKKITANDKSNRGQRYPVAYTNTDELLEKIDLDVTTIDWLPFKVSPNAEEPLESEESELSDLPDIVAEAKEIIAEAASVDVDQVEIKINF